MTILNNDQILFFIMLITLILSIYGTTEWNLKRRNEKIDLDYNKAQEKHCKNFNSFLFVYPQNGTRGNQIVNATTGFQQFRLSKLESKRAIQSNLTYLQSKNSVFNQALNQLLSENNGFTSDDLLKRVVAISNNHYTLQRKGVSVEPYIENKPLVITYEV